MWMSKSYDVCWPALPSWGLLTVYAAVLGSEASYLTEEEGTDIINKKGQETWDNTNKTSNSTNLSFSDPYKKLKITGILNKLICNENPYDEFI